MTDQYFRLRDTAIDWTWQVSADVLVDVDSDGHPVGIELLGGDSTKHLSKFTEALIAIADRAVIFRDGEPVLSRDEQEDDAWTI